MKMKSLVVLYIAIAGYVLAQDCVITNNPCPDPSNKGFYADPVNCRKYYDCEPDNTYRCTCPMGNPEDEAWNAANKYCDYLSRVDCGDIPLCDVNDENCEDHHVTTRPPCPLGQCDSIMCTADLVGGYFEYAPCDQKYCHCVFLNMNACVEECPPGTIFKPDSNDFGTCDFPDSVPGCSV